MATQNIPWLRARIRFLEGKEEGYEKALKDTRRRLANRRQDLAAAERAAASKPPTKVSAKALEFVASFEGWVNHPYNDPAGHATIGFGHLLHRGPVTQGDRDRWGTISRERGKAILRGDMEQFERGVLKLVKVPLAQNQFDALVSFAFNVGLGALGGSTLLKLLNERKYKAAADQFPRWVMAGGQRLPGLVRRREAERKLFLTK